MKKRLLALTLFLMFFALPARAEIAIGPIFSMPMDDSLMPFYAAQTGSDGFPCMIQAEGLEGRELDYFDFVPLGGGGYAALCGMTAVMIRNGAVVESIDLVPGDEAIPAAIFPARDGFFVFMGETKWKDRHGGTFHAAVLEKRDGSGAMEWRRVFDEHEVMLSGVMPAEDGYIAYGCMEEQWTGKRYALGFAAKITHTGELAWVAQARAPEGNISFTAAAPAPDGGVMLAGGNTLRRQPKIGLLVKPFAACLTPDGTIRWQQSYDLGPEASDFRGIVPVENGYLVLWNEISYQPPLYLLGMDAGGAVAERFVLDTQEARNAWTARLELISGKPYLLFRELREETAGEGGSVKWLHGMAVDVRP